MSSSASSDQLFLCLPFVTCSATFGYDVIDPAHTSGYMNYLLEASLPDCHRQLMMDTKDSRQVLRDRAFLN